MVDIIVAGHICLDLLPGMDDVPLSALSATGMLFEVDALNVSTGGAVANSGVSLHVMGTSVGMMGKVGDDLIGRVIIATLKDRDPELSAMVKVQPGSASSYTIALSPENSDRIFLHCPGTNDTFGIEDIDFAQVKDAKIFHLGYPPLLPHLYSDGGDELAEIMRRVKDLGVVTSMDTAQPAPNKPAGHVYWRALLEKVLPYVDVFVPSVEEITFMLHRDAFDSVDGEVLGTLDADKLAERSGELIDMGAAIVGLKMSSYGIYLQATGDGERLQSLNLPGFSVADWQGAAAYHPAFAVDVVGTTGAGDAAYAAILTGLLRGLPPARVVQLANAAGALNVRAADATSGVLPWDEMTAKVDGGWATLTRVVPGF